MRILAVVVLCMGLIACGGGASSVPTTEVTIIEQLEDGLGINGVVRNDADESVRLVAVVEWLDEDGNVIGGGARETTPEVVEPGATAEFGVLLPPDPEERARVKAYRLTFEREQ